MHVCCLYEPTQSVSLLQICNDDGSLSFYTMEDIFPDYRIKFIKYNSNWGFVNKTDFASTLNAFSHWTYEHTKHYLMVVDLQVSFAVCAEWGKYVFKQQLYHYYQFFYILFFLF